MRKSNPHFLYFLFYPRHKEINNSLLLTFRKSFSLLHVIPLFKATPTTAGTSVLGNEYGVASHRSLSAVVWYFGRGKTLFYKVGCVASYGFSALFVIVCLFFMVSRKIIELIRF